MLRLSKECVCQFAYVDLTVARIDINLRRPISVGLACIDANTYVNYPILLPHDYRFKS